MCNFATWRRIITTKNHETIIVLATMVVVKFAATITSIARMSYTLTWCVKALFWVVFTYSIFKQEMQSYELVCPDCFLFGLRTEFLTACFWPELNCLCQFYLLLHCVMICFNFVNKKKKTGILKKHNTYSLPFRFCFVFFLRHARFIKTLLIANFKILNASFDAWEFIFNSDCHREISCY